MSERINQPTGSNISSNLPTLASSTVSLLHRTQTVVELLRDVVQESSAEYWYERGTKATEREEWDEAIFSFKQCSLINKYSLKPLEALATVYRNRSSEKMREGDRDGSVLDEDLAKSLDDYLDYLVGMIDAMSQYSD
jgi:hypothetical protein